MPQEFVFPPEVLEFMKNNPDKKAQMEVELIISHEENGKQIVEQCIHPHSFVQAFMYILGVQMRQTNANATILDQSDVARTLTFTGSQSFEAIQAANLDTIGIQVGTGTTAIAMTNNKLATKIAHGSAATQLQYAACTVSQVTISGSDCYVTIDRQFTNASGASITVNEVGLIGLGKDSGGSNFGFLIDRTLNTTTIANATSKNYTYKIKIVI